MEYDLENLRPQYTVDAYGGPIWTISSNSQGTQLAVSVNLLDVILHFRYFLRQTHQEVLLIH